MGYRRERKTIRLVFDDETLAGLEVRARSISFGRVLDLMRIADTLRGGRDGFTAEQQAELRKLFAAFAESLISWNLEDEDGGAVPTTLAGLLDQDTGLVMDLVLAWMDGVTATSAPLERRSSGGEPSPAGELAELSIPMEPPSASPALSPVPN